MIRFVTTVALACTYIVVYAQSDDHSQEFTRSILKTKNGVMVVYNSDARGFSIQMRADSIRALDQSDFMELDGTLFQANLIPVPTSQPIDTLTLEQQRAVLKAYVPFELKYFADNDIACANVKTVYLTLGGHLFLRWSFDILPGHAGVKDTKQYARGQIYYSTVAFDQILDLNTPLLKHTDTFVTCNTLLVKVARSLALSPTPIDLDRKYSELNQ